MSKLTIEPINDNVCVLRHEAAYQVGRIIVPTTAQDPPRLGDVIATGPDVKQVKANDTVVFADYTGIPVPLNDENFLMMREEEILAIVK